MLGALAVAGAVAGACTGSSETERDPDPTTTTATMTTATTTTSSSLPEGLVRLSISGVVLRHSDPSSTLRLVVTSPAASIEVEMPGVIDTPTGRLRVCPVEAAGPARPGDSDCVLAGAGEHLELPHRPRYSGIDLGLIETTGTGQIVDEVLLDDVQVLYRPAGPEMTVGLPPAAAGVSVVLEREPTSTRPFTAEASWASTGTALLALRAGASVNATAEGPSPLQAQSQVSPPASATLTFEATTDLPGATITVAWP